MICFARVLTIALNSRSEISKINYPPSGSKSIRRDRPNQLTRRNQLSRHAASDKDRTTYNGCYLIIKMRRLDYPPKTSKITVLRMPIRATRTHSPKGLSGRKLHRRFHLFASVWDDGEKISSVSTVRNRNRWIFFR